MKKNDSTKATEKTYAEQFGENIRRIWKGGSLKNVTLQGLAMKANISVSYLSEILNGKKTPSPETQASIAQALSVRVCDLLPDKWLYGNIDEDGNITPEIEAIRYKMSNMSAFERRKSLNMLKETMRRFDV